MNVRLLPTARGHPGQATARIEGGAKSRPIRPNPVGIYAVVVALWLAFGAALLVGPGSLANLWERFGDWPLVVQAIVALLLLPWVVATWIWQTGWPVWVRLVLDAGLAWATLYAFFPRTR